MQIIRSICDSGTMGWRAKCSEPIADGQKIRRLLAIERSEDHTAPARPPRRQLLGHFEHDRDGGRVIIGAPIDLAAACPQVIVMRPNKDPSV